MDGCPRREDPSFPGRIITLWLKFAFNCTALASFLVALTSLPRSRLHATCVAALRPHPHLVPPPTPSILSAYLPGIWSWPAGGYCVCGPLEIANKACHQGASFLEGWSQLLRFVMVHMPQQSISVCTGKCPDSGLWTKKVTGHLCARHRS